MKLIRLRGRKVVHLPNPREKELRSILVMIHAIDVIVINQVTFLLQGFFGQIIILVPELCISSLK
jgi:hypothetical protein